jgi:hypothetical protein
MIPGLPGRGLLAQDQVVLRQDHSWRAGCQGIALALRATTAEVRDVELVTWLCRPERTVGLLAEERVGAATGSFLTSDGGGSGGEAGCFAMSPRETPRGGTSGAMTGSFLASCVSADCTGSSRDNRGGSEDEAGCFAMSPRGDCDSGGAQRSLRRGMSGAARRSFLASWVSGDCAGSSCNDGLVP